MSVGVAAVLAGILGAVVGSLLSAVACRLPRKESLLRGWGERNSPRDRIVEAATGLLCAACVLRFGADRDVWLPLVFVLLLVPITLIDLDHHIIPNVLTAIGAVAALVLVVALESDDLTEHLIAGVAAGGFFLLAALVYPAGMGMGDVKLAGVMGLFLGRDVVPAIFAALIAGTVIGAFVIARLGAKEGRKKGIPFGPWLALGSLVGLFAGDAIVDWYLDSYA